MKLFSFILCYTDKLEEMSFLNFDAVQVLRVISNSGKTVIGFYVLLEYTFFKIVSERCRSYTNL